MVGKKIKSKRKKNLKRDTIKDKKKILTHSYNMNYSNWSKRGSACFNEIQRVGIKFIDDLLRTRLVCEDLSIFGTSIACTSELVNDPPVTNSMPNSMYSKGSKEWAEELWCMLCNIVKSSLTLVSFQYYMESEKWIEIKRNFNVILVNGETIPDIIIKIVLRVQDDKHLLEYYLRCLGKLIKRGTLSSKGDVINIIRTLGRNKYVCIGIEKDKYIYQVDNNERIRQCIKSYGSLSTVPFESIYHKDCKAVVRDSPNLDNYKFRRGEKTICGPLAVCSSCEDLFNKLEEYFNPSLDITRENHFKPPRQRYGPVESLNVSKKIKKLCTESVYEFVKDAQKDMECFRKLGIETEVSPRKSDFFADADSSDDERPTITVNEQDFEKMLIVKKPLEVSLKNKLDKICDRCGFVSDSMLSLFMHMSEHIVTPVEERGSHTSSNASSEHEKTLNPRDKEEEAKFSTLQVKTSNEIYNRENSEITIKPYLCIYCDMRMQTLNDYKKHMKSYHQMNKLEEMNFLCTECQTYFYTRNHLLIHELNFNHMDKTGMKCPICGKTHNSLSAFQTHIQNYSDHQRELHSLLLCYGCKKFFFSNLELKEHENNNCCHPKEEHATDTQFDKPITENIKMYTCGICYKTYDTLHAIQKHVQNCQANEVISSEPPMTTEARPSAPLSPSSVYSYSCNMCGMKFASEYYLNIHMNLHPNRVILHSSESEDFFYFKRNQELDTGSLKEMEKSQPQILQQQSQHLPTYNQVCSEQSTFPEGQGQETHNMAQSVVQSLTQSDVMEVSSPEIDWTKPTIASIEEHSDTVYSLLHL